MKYRVIRRSDIARCPIKSLSAAHYRDDGTCLCSEQRRRPWRRCSSCGGVCHWHDTDWVCRDCGDEWSEDFAPKYAAPGG